MDEIGARLREARMGAKIDINEVEARTKIRAKYLRAMENEEWDLLPGEVYIRSFLRTYGEFLGLDARQLVDDFRRRYESPTDHEPPPIVPPSRERQRGPRRRGVPSWAIIGAVLVVVIVVLVIVGTHNNSPSSATTSSRHAQASSSKTSTTAGSHAARRRRVHRVPARPATVRLSLVPTGLVYVCLVNGSGKVLIPGQEYDTGQTIPVQTAAKLLLTLGNASITLKADGVPVAVAASSGAIGLEFTPGGHTTLAPGNQPTCTSG